MANLSLKATIELIDKMTAPMRGIASQADRLSRQFDVMGQSAKEIVGHQRLIDSFKKQSKQVSETSEKYKEAQQRLDMLSKKMAQAVKPSQTLTKQFESAQRNFEKIESRLTNQNIRLATTKKKLNEVGISTANLSKHEETLAKSIEKSNKQLAEHRKRLTKVRHLQSQWSKQKSRWQSARNSGATTALGGVAVMSAPIGAFAEAESAATSLKVSMMDSTGQVSKQYEQINALAERLGTSLPGSTSDFSLMMQKLIQQGISAEKILGGVGEASANLAVVMKMPFDQSAEFAAKMQDATKTSANDMLELMDVIQKSYYLGMDSTNMLSGFSKLSAGMKTVRMEGLKGAKALAPLLVMADQASMSGESAGNAYSKIFKSMLDTKKLTKATKGTGINLDFTNGSGEFGGIDNMFIQLEKLKPLSTEVRNNLLAGAFGNDSETIQALNLIIDKGKTGYEETIAKMEKQANLQQRVNAQLGTLTNLWDAAKGTFTSAMVSFGEALAPELKNLVGFITDLSTKLGAWAKENPELAGFLMKIIALVTLVGGGLAILATAMLSILGPIAMLRTAFTALGLSMSVNPIFLAIGLLATAAFLIYQNWGPIKEFFLGLWNSITAGLNQFANWVTAKWQALKQGVINFANQLWSGLGIKFSGGIQALIGIIIAFSPLALFIRAFAAVWSYFSGLSAKFRQYGANILDGLKQGILAKAQAVIGAIKNIVGRIKGAFTGVRGMDIHSPSRVFDSYGGYMMQGLAGGIIGNAKLPINATKTLTGQIKATAPLSIGSGLSGRIDTRKSILTGGGGTGAMGGAITININGATDPQAVAREVERVLANKTSMAHSRRRSQLWDID